jgi:hypothetical protein
VWDQPAEGVIAAGLQKNQLHDEEVTFHSPHDSQVRGIEMIYQDFSLCSISCVRVAWHLIQGCETASQAVSEFKAKADALLGPDTGETQGGSSERSPPRPPSMFSSRYPYPFVLLRSGNRIHFKAILREI